MHVALACALLGLKRPGVTLTRDGLQNSVRIMDFGLARAERKATPPMVSDAQSTAPMTTLKWHFCGANTATKCWQHFVKH